MSDELHDIQTTILNNGYAALTYEQLISMRDLSLADFSSIVKLLSSREHGDWLASTKESVSDSKGIKSARSSVYLVFFPKTKEDSNKTKNSTLQDTLMVFCQDNNKRISKFIHNLPADVLTNSFDLAIQKIPRLHTKELIASSIEQKKKKFYSADIPAAVLIKTIRDNAKQLGVSTADADTASSLYRDSLKTSALKQMLVRSLVKIPHTYLNSPKTKPYWALLRLLNIEEQEWKRLALSNIEMNILNKIHTWGLNPASPEYDPTRASILTLMNSNAFGWVKNETAGIFRYPKYNHDALSVIVGHISNSPDTPPTTSVSLETNRKLKLLKEMNLTSTKGTLTSEAKARILHPLTSHLTENPVEAYYFKPYLDFFIEHRDKVHSIICAKAGVTISEALSLDHQSDINPAEGIATSTYHSPETEIELYSELKELASMLGHHKGNGLSYPQAIINNYMSNFTSEVLAPKGSSTQNLDDFLLTSPDSEKWNKYCDTDNNGKARLSQKGLSYISRALKDLKDKHSKNPPQRPRKAASQKLR